VDIDKADDNTHDEDQQRLEMEETLQHCSGSRVQQPLRRAC